MSHPYCDPAFADAHRHLGTPVALPASGSYAYLRPIPAGTATEAAAIDAAALYPLWHFRTPAGIASDLAMLANAGAISFVGVCPPLPAAIVSLLEPLSDCWRPFKQHYLYDPSLPFQYDKHHRYELKQAMREVQISWQPFAPLLSAWCKLYGHLQAKHGLSGLHAFPNSYFAALATLSDLIVGVATIQDMPVAMHLWLDDGQILWSHLAASSELGYRCRAAYAINAAAIDRYGGERLINFGGAAGLGDDKEDGLARFKRGFSNRSEFSWLFGKILNRKEYDSRCTGLAATSYFPAYRQPGRGA